MNKFNQITTPTANMPERHEKKNILYIFSLHHQQHHPMLLHSLAKFMKKYY